MTFFQLSTSYAQTETGPLETGPLVLQEMSWVDVQEYLEANDMAIIPIGSTEQHGPHLPLGSDIFEAIEISKLISQQTGVIVSPVLLVGYSEYHSGFPGTLSLKPETMEQVLFESVEMLMKYGFKRFLLFNEHGGNNIVQTNLVHRINHTTEAIAIAIGVGHSIWSDDEGEFFDWHAGKAETSVNLYLNPELVRMDRAKKPEIHFTPHMEKLKSLSEESPELVSVWDGLFGVPVETNKGGASHELSSNGIWSFSDPKEATREMGQDYVNKQVERAVAFIEAWKQAGARTGRAE
jgi:creatinine amidohydrolase